MNKKNLTSVVFDETFVMLNVPIMGHEGPPAGLRNISSALKFAADSDCRLLCSLTKREEQLGVTFSLLDENDYFLAQKFLPAFPHFSASAEYMIMLANPRYTPPPLPADASEEENTQQIFQRLHDQQPAIDNVNLSTDHAYEVLQDCLGEWFETEDFPLGHLQFHLIGELTPIILDELESGHENALKPRED